MIWRGDVVEMWGLSGRLREMGPVLTSIVSGTIMG